MSKTTVLSVSKDLKAEKDPLKTGLTKHLKASAFRIPNRYLKQRTVGSISDSDTLAQGAKKTRYVLSWAN